MKEFLEDSGSSRKPRTIGTRGRIHRRTVYVATVVALLAVFGGYALAATSSFTLPTPGATGGAGAGSASASTFTEATLSSISIVATNPESGGAALGTQTTGAPVGTFSGTMAAQSGCDTASTTCNSYWAPAAQTTTAPASADYSVVV